MNLPYTVKSKTLTGAEVSWFAPICNGDDEFLGAHDPKYRSSWENASRIAKTATALGFRNMLCPSSYQVGQDTLPFVAGLAPQLEQMNLLAAVRCGEVHPPMLARTLATIDHMAKGKLTVNIISSDLPGEKLPSEDRYQRSREVIEILKQAWTQEEISIQGQFYNFTLKSDPGKPYQQNGGPLLYFGGYSPPGLQLCAEHCDVYLLWPNTEDVLQKQIHTMADLAAKEGRTIDYGLRVHVIVRETEAEAIEASRRLMSQINVEQGDEIRNRAQDAKSLGVAKQSELREGADNDGFAEEQLWTGIGAARSGCGAAIVGNPDQVLAKIRRYQAMGFRSFIFSGYPHLDEAKLFARYVLPEIETVSLPRVYGRIPEEVPMTPLGAGERR
ncbi:MAG TPA: alkanesulfonate monooxygenase [Cytophagales bacterium]|nr:alkanesulfonate monooxygenase [Cytophagales bacterium]